MIRGFTVVAGPADVTGFPEPGGDCGTIDHQIGALGVALPVERVKGNSHGHQIVAIVQDREVGG